MSKKRDPVIAIVAYFTDADLLQAEVTITIVKEIVRKRRQHFDQLSPRAESAPRSHKKAPGRRGEVEPPLPLDALAPVS